MLFPGFGLAGLAWDTASTELMLEKDSVHVRLTLRRGHQAQGCTAADKKVHQKFDERKSKVDYMLPPCATSHLASTAGKQLDSNLFHLTESRLLTASQV